VNARAQQENPLVITIDTKDKAQVIQNIGVSGCWYSEPVGKYWPAEKKQRIAELLFSKKMDNAGNPAGIGVSAFRFNVGAGTAETGIAGGIADPNHRVECFLNPDGSYNWHRQPGYQWFLQQAKKYGVENFLIFSNSPPVQFTENGFGFKTKKDAYANLKPENYNDYAGFLATVIEHFDKEGLHFNYVSPVNEPQWDWTGKVGEAKQEGTPWTNEEIVHVIRSLDSALQFKKLKTQITAAEAGMLSFLYGGKTPASCQIQNFFSDTAQLSLAHLPTVGHLLAGHSYFTDSNDSNLVTIRKNLADTARKYNVDFWQSEYCMLGNGYKEGATGSRTPMDCALFLSKIIHTDLTIANATAWHYWNAYEPGNADRDNRYYLIALKPDSGFTNGSFTATKNLWALGHYSLFIRP
jgi:O-glycosyl hydrolase